jgi:hypothetical protein
LVTQFREHGRVCRLVSHPSQDPSCRVASSLWTLRRDTSARYVHPILLVGNIISVIGDTHVAQCTILGRPAFRHFGTEIADGAIVENTLRHGYRRLEPHAAFARDRMTWVLPSAATAEERAEAARRAESKIGQRAYNLFWNNCEHFASWCATGIAVSQQVIVGMRKVRGAISMLAGGFLAWAGLVVLSAAFDG